MLHIGYEEVVVEARNWGQEGEWGMKGERMLRAGRSTSGGLLVGRLGARRECAPLSDPCRRTCLPLRRRRRWSAGSCWRCSRHSWRRRSARWVGGWGATGPLGWAGSGRPGLGSGYCMLHGVQRPCTGSSFSYRLQYENVSAGGQWESSSHTAGLGEHMGREKFMARTAGGCSKSGVAGARAPLRHRHTPGTRQARGCPGGSSTEKGVGYARVLNATGCRLGRMHTGTAAPSTTQPVLHHQSTPWSWYLGPYTPCRRWRRPPPRPPSSSLCRWTAGWWSSRSCSCSRPAWSPTSGCGAWVVGRGREDQGARAWHGYRMGVGLGSRTWAGERPWGSGTE